MAVSTLALRKNRARRMHTKSRTGCRNCKLRKIKCDEHRPSCYNCSCREATCDFQREASSVPFPKVPIPKASSNGKEADFPWSSAQGIWPMSPDKALEVPLYEGQNMDARLLELRLFNYFINEASNSKWLVSDLSSFALDHQLLTKTIPQLALSSNYLMDALISVAACNIRFSQPSNPVLAAASHKYMSRSISTYRSVLTTNVSEQSFDTLYMTSMIIGCHMLMQRQFQAKDDLFGSLQQWLQAFQGTKLIANMSPALCSTSRLAFNFPAGGWQNSMAVDIDFSGISSDAFAFLIDDMDSSIPQLDQIAYQNVVTYFSLLYLSPSPGLMWSFLLEGQNHFVVCLARGESKAQLLLGVYLCYVDLFNVDRPMGRVAKLDLEVILEKISNKEERLLQRAISMLRAKFGRVSAEPLLLGHLYLLGDGARPEKHLVLR